MESILESGRPTSIFLCCLQKGTVVFLFQPRFQFISLCGGQFAYINPQKKKNTYCLYFTLTCE